MDPAPRAIDQEELLAQMTWVTALARSLVRDPNLAQDVAQQTWLTALERPPHTARSGPGLRAWLASVTRSTARGLYRGEGRRHTREQRAAQPEAQVATVDVVARGEQQRMLVDAVLELDEPSRSTILLRYLDGLSGPEIAERMSVSPAAVRKRLSRGLEQLRQRLDASHQQDRGAWMLALMPLARLGKTAPGTLAGSGGLTLGAKTTLGLGFALIVSIAWVVWPPTHELPELGGEGFAPRAVAEATQLPTPLTEATPTQALGLSAAEDLRRISSVADPEDWNWRPFSGSVSGQVVDLAGRAVAKVRMAFEPTASPGADELGRAALTTRADAEGRFELDGIRHRGQVFVASSEHVTVFPGNTDASGLGGGQTIVVAPRRRHAGRVLGPTGAPVADARVAVLLPEGFEARFERSFEFASTFECETRSDASGAFQLDRAPALEGAVLEIEHEGFLVQRQQLPTLETHDLVVRLQRPAHRLSGQVLDATGMPVAGAAVGCGPRSTHSDASGQFSFHFDDEALNQLEGDSLRLIAVRTGAQPGSLELSVDREAEAFTRDGLVLSLGPPARSLSGRVVDPRGQPLEGVRVWVADPTVLSRNPEYLRARGRATEGEDLHSGWRAGLPDPSLVVESVAAGRPEEMWNIVDTDELGRFELPGLLDREYVVAAMFRKSLQRIDSPPVHAGRDDLRLVLDARDVYASVSGRVLSRRGEPLAGILVALRGSGLRLAGHHSMHSAARGFTAADGTFRLTNVPRQAVSLWFSGSDVLATGHGDGAPLGRPGAEHVTGLEVVLPLRMQLRVELDDPSEANRLRVLDAAGEPLMISTFQFDRRRLRPAVELRDGRSELLSVTDDAAFAELLRDETSVRRVPLTLLRGDVNPIH